MRIGILLVVLRVPALFSRTGTPVLCTAGSLVLFSRTAQKRKKGFKIINKYRWFFSFKGFYSIRNKIHIEFSLRNFFFCLKRTLKIKVFWRSYNISMAIVNAFKNWSISSFVLYKPNEILTVPGILKCCITGSAQ